MKAARSLERRAPERGIAAAVGGVILAGFGLALLQRGLLLTTSAGAGSAANIVEFDLGLWGLWLVLSPATVAAARRWPLRISPASDLARHLIAAIGLAFAHTVMFVTVLRLRAHERLEVSVIDVTTAMLAWRLAIDVFIYATLVAVVLAIDATRREHARDRAALASSAESTKARLAALELQIRPHFLFNTLNTATMLARTDRAEESAEVITKLSELLRELVAESPGETVPLRQELSFVARYLDIEKTRFGERFRPTIRASDDALAVAVPRLLLQPVVENAVRHGLSRSATSGRIDVHAELATPDMLVVTVADDGPGPNVGSDSANGLGLQNIRSRLGALYGDSASLVMSAGPGGGTLVTIRLPVALSPDTP